MAWNKRVRKAEVRFENLFVDFRVMESAEGGRRMKERKEERRNRGREGARNGRAVRLEALRTKRPWPSSLLSERQLE